LAELLEFPRDEWQFHILKGIVVMAIEWSDLLCFNELNEAERPDAVVKNPLHSPHSEST